MRRVHLGLLTLVVPVLAASLLTLGCGKETKPEGSSGGGGGGGGGGSGEKVSAKDMKPLEAKGGTVKGKITLKGPAPDTKALTEKLVADIDKKEDQKDYCKKGDDFEHQEFTYRIGDNKQVGNVFVWLKPEKGEFFKLDDKQIKDLKEHKAVIDQPHCAFVPHCLVYVPKYRDPADPSEHKSTGQKLVVKNSAEVSHNTNVGGWNEIISAKSEKEPPALKENKDFEIRCNIHPWMRGYIRTFDHPYATVSLAEPQAKTSDDSFGTYEIKNTPVGKMRIIAWHEKAGFLTKPEGEEITIKEGAPASMDFELEAK